MQQCKTIFAWKNNKSGLTGNIKVIINCVHEGKGRSNIYGLQQKKINKIKIL